MTNIKVKVKEGAFPIRYKEERFLVGDELTIEEKYFNENTMELVEEATEPKKTATRTTAKK